MIVEVAALGAAVGVGGGAYAAVKVVNWLPMRSPSNARRIANAKTDADLAAIARKRAEAEAETAIVLAKKEATRIRFDGEAEVLRMRVDRAKQLEARETSAAILDNTEEFGPLVLATRRAKGWTQKYLAGQTFLRVQRVSEIERVEGGAPSDHEMKRLAAVLGLDYVPGFVARPETTPTVPQLEPAVHFEDGSIA